MFAQTSSTRGRTQGGGDAQPRNVQEPCVYFLKGQCKKGTRCRYRHIQSPNKNSDKRVFTSNKKPRRPQGNFQASNQQAGHRRQAGRQPLTCYSCGKPGHFKRDCRSSKRDSANMGLDLVLPAVELDVPVQVHPSLSLKEPMCIDIVNVAAGQREHLSTRWLIDGGASCHVVGFDPGAALQRRRSASIEILVGGGRKIQCQHVGDLAIIVRTYNPKALSRLTLRDVRVVPGFGMNLLSTPRMEKAGWYLSQGGGHFNARDSQGRTVFSIVADFKGMYYLNNVSISNGTSPMASFSANVGGQRNFPSTMEGELSEAPQFLAMGVGDKNCQVRLLPSTTMYRREEAQATTSNTNSQLHALVAERGEIRNSSPITRHPLPYLSPTSSFQGSERETWQGLKSQLGEDRLEVSAPVVPSVTVCQRRCPFRPTRACIL